MTSTYTTNNRIEIPAGGDYFDTWDVLWSNLANIIDQSLDGVEEVTVSGSVTLTANNNASDQSRNRVLILTGPGGALNVNEDSTANLEKVYLIHNNCSGAVTVTQGAGTTTVLPAYAAAWVACYTTGGVKTCLNVGYVDRGWKLVGTTSASGNSFDVTIPERCTRARLRMVNLTHAAGANRDLTVAAYEGVSTFQIGATPFQTMTTATAYNGDISLEGSTSIFQSVSFVSSTAAFGTCTMARSGGFTTKLDKVTFSLSGGATFSAGSVLLEVKP